jgi:hypothetical protein
MAPKTANEIEIVGLSNSLPKVSKKQFNKAFKQCFVHYFVQLHKEIFCLECGHKWKLADKSKVTCEKCSKNLVLAKGYKNGLKETDYFQIVTTIAEFQVVRMFCLVKTMRKNTMADLFAHEVMQTFYDQTGKSRTLAKNVMGMSMYYDSWVIHNEISLKPKDFNKRNVFYLTPSYIKYEKSTPIFERNGFKGQFYGLSAQVLFTEIIKDNIAETLLKSNQFKLLYHHIQKRSFKVDGKYWNSIKICIRNNYQMDDVSLWLDYIDLLEYFTKDLRNAKFVCPSNLKVEHDRLMAKKIEKEQEEIVINFVKEQKLYAKAKKKFFGMIFTNENISISVIESVKDFFQEGLAHHHCLFTNEYYKKANCLILSAKVDNQPMETIEIALDKLTIVQSRGTNNKASKYNEEIINLVTKNLHQIGARMKVAC